MFGLVVIEVMTPSGHLSNINEICGYLTLFHLAALIGHLSLWQRLLGGLFCNDK